MRASVRRGTLSVLAGVALATAAHAGGALGLPAAGSDHETVAVTTASFSPSYAVAPPSDEPADNPVRITADDVNLSNQKALAAYNALVAQWGGEFDAIGAQFAAPRLVRYRAPVRSACGVIAPRNAAYCVMDNTIYFDDLFVAAQAKLAGSALGTDGDMAGVGIIAHEMGHAVAMQLGFRSRRTYDNEAVADCLTGAFAKQSEIDGMLEDGDLDEAFFGMAAAADPVFEPTGNGRMDRAVAARLARSAHGTREQRTQNFERGLRGGGGSCLPQLQSA